MDVHVLTHEGTRADWLDQCLQSLHGQLCQVHVVENRHRSFSEGRAHGYSLGSSEYVGFVDSDDWVSPDCIEVAAAALRHSKAVCTMEVAMYEGKPLFRAPRPGHHFFAAHREAVAPHLEKLASLGHAADRALREKLRPSQVAHVGYFWRIHAGQYHRQIDAAQYAQAMKEL